MRREATPSFALLDVQGPVIVTYVYQQVDGEVSYLSTRSSPIPLFFYPLLGVGLVLSSWPG
jgi:hypothetical protein